MMVSTATDKSQTIKRKIELTSSTALPTRQDRYKSAITELSECFFEPIIECSMIRPGSRLGNYLIGEDDELAYWRVAAERSIRKAAAFSNASRTGYPSIGAVCDVKYPPSSDDPYVAYSANSMLHMSAQILYAPMGRAAQ